jgi:hypothetical protein
MQSEICEDVVEVLLVMLLSLDVDEFITNATLSCTYTVLDLAKVRQN